MANKLEKQSAYSLPEETRQLITEECKNKAKTNAQIIGVFIMFLGLLIIIGLSMMTVSDSNGGSRIGILPWLLPFFAALAVMAYQLFIRPRKRIKQAEAGRYQCVIGELTSAEDQSDDDSSSYYLVLEGQLKIKCDRADYRKAELGESYIAVFFAGESSPSLCVQLPPKDLI